MNYKHLIVAAGTVAMVGVVILLWPSRTDVSIGSLSSVVPTPMSGLRQRPTTPTQAQPSSQLALIAPAERLSAKFNRLVATGKPRDAFTAYQMSAECAASRWWQTKEKQLQDPTVHQDSFKSLPPPETACDDLSPGQIATRVELLRRAATAGVHGAYGALNLEGPGGILQGLPSTTEWVRLSEVSFDAGLSTADPISLIERSGQAANCPNVPLCSNPSGDNLAEALKYLIAFRESQMRDAGPFNPEQERALQTVISRYSAALAPDVIAKSVNDGKALVDAAKVP